MSLTVKKENLNQISLPIIFLSLSIIVNLINNQKFGAALPIQIVPIVLYFLSLLINKRKIIFNITHILILILWFIISLSSLTSIFLIEEIGIIYFLIFALFYIFTTGIVIHENEFNYIIKIYIYTAVIGSINIIINFMMVNYYQIGRYSTTFFGISKDPNYASAIIVPAIFLTLYLMTKQKSILNYFNVLILTTGVLLTGSRASFIVLFFSYMYFLLLFFFKLKISLIRKIIIIIVIVTIAFSFWPSISNILPEGLIDRVTQVDSYSDNIRLKIWHIILEDFKNSSLLNFLFGLGLDSSNIISVKYTNTHTHNIYIDLLFSSGIIGFCVFILILIFNLKNGKANIHYLFGLIIIFLGPLFFINGLNTSSFWLPMIIINIFANYTKSL